MWSSRGGDGDSTAKLTTDNIGIGQTPVGGTECSPSSRNIHLHLPLTLRGAIFNKSGSLGRHTLRWGVVGRKFGEVWGQEGYRLRQRKGLNGGADATKALAHGGAVDLGWTCRMVTN